jgi:CubicO group peptidase (beta-lactamase class C family)
MLMRRHSLFGVLCVLPAVLQSQTQSERPDSQPIRTQLDSIVSASLTDLPLASASVAILRGSDTLLWTAQGYADLENRIPASPSTVYPIGSITKQFTAAAILQQVERGAIGLDDEVAKYVPEYSSRGKRVTIRQLLNHTSGIRDINDLGDAFSRTLRVNLPQKDILALIRDQPFNFEPGSRWSYNNTGYYLLGVVLERVTGVPYADYVRDNVAAPAGLVATTYCDSRRLIPHRARGYDPVGLDFLNATYLALNLFSAVGLCSTAGDLVTWARALRGGKVISRESYSLMTTPEGAAARAHPPYGFGLWVIDYRGRRYLSRLGLLAGFNAVLSEIPSDSLTIAVVTNTSGLGASTLAGQLRSAILGIPGPPFQKARQLEQTEGRPLTKSQFRRYIGRYALREVRDDSLTSPDRVTLQVFDENGRLTAQLTGDPPETLTPVGDNKFSARGRPDMQFSFEVRQQRATAVTFDGPDGEYKGPRVSDR